MTDDQWNQLLAVIRGGTLDRIPTGFIIDCPWLPGWHGTTIAEYLSSETIWLEANLAAINRFPETWFLPGFWSEFGMCTEPSAFGSRCSFPPNEFPFADKIIDDPDEIANLRQPDPSRDGLLPFMLNRLRWAQPAIERAGHRIRFSVSRGPLNIATFLMGTTEFLTAIVTDPEEAHRLLRVITGFLKDWHALQRETFPSIDGIMMLDDIVGFIGEEHFLEFGAPYLKELYDADVNVKFFHNDAPCAQSIRHYHDLGINLYNPGIQTPLAEMRALCENKLTILGTIPPRDVLADGSPEQVGNAVTALLDSTPDHSRLILSCAGGMPPGVRSGNIDALIDAARAATPGGGA